MVALVINVVVIITNWLMLSYRICWMVLTGVNQQLRHICMNQFFFLIFFFYYCHCHHHRHHHRRRRRRVKLINWLFLCCLYFLFIPHLFESFFVYIPYTQYFSAALSVLTHNNVLNLITIITTITICYLFSISFSLSLSFSFSYSFISFLFDMNVQCKYGFHFTSHLVAARNIFVCTTAKVRWRYMTMGSDNVTKRVCKRGEHFFLSSDPIFFPLDFIYTFSQFYLFGIPILNIRKSWTKSNSFIQSVELNCIFTLFFSTDFFFLLMHCSSKFCSDFFCTFFFGWP